MHDTLRMTAVLLLIALCSGLAVGVTYQKTASRIHAMREAAQDAGVQAVLPPDVAIEMRRGKEGLPAQYWVARRDTHVVAYAFMASAHGYSSDIRVIAGVDTSGHILGVRILDQQETPGLGTRIAEAVSRRYLWNGLGKDTEQAAPWFTEQFRGLDLEKRIVVDYGREWHALGDAQRERLAGANTVSAVSGATISTKAVIKALEASIYSSFRMLRGGT